jgi:hypothetical protein
MDALHLRGQTLHCHDTPTNLVVRVCAELVVYRLVVDTETQHLSELRSVICGVHWLTVNRDISPIVTRLARAIFVDGCFEIGCNKTP